MTQRSLQSILLVDDDEIFHFVSKVFIDKLNLDVEVHTVFDGMEALDFLEEVNVKLKKDDSFVPCLLILDINMPVMNGWKFLDAYINRFSNEIKNNIVIVMATVSEDERDLIQASNNPIIREYIQKPLTDVKLMQIMEKYFFLK